METSKRLDKDNVDVVVYHANCCDGYGGAFSVWYYYKCKFGVERANQIYYKKGSHNEDMSHQMENFYNKFVGKNVVIVDFSYKYEILIKIIEVAQSFVILDHHVSAMKSLEQVPDNLKVFDMNRSGAGIAWDYFHVGKPMPKFLQHIQDRDLWKFALPDTKEFVTFFFEIKYDFSIWEEYLKDEVCEKVIETGKQWMAYKQITVEKTARQASRIIQVISDEYVIVGYTNSYVFGSEVCEEILIKNPIIDFSVSTIYNVYKDFTSFSLRSTDTRFDVSAIAVANGGGGHRNASGARKDGCAGVLPYEQLKNNYLEILESMKIEYIDHETDSVTIKIPCIFFDATELGKKFFRKPEKKFIDLIHRKFKNANFIVLQIIKKLSGKYYTPSYNILRNPHYNVDETAGGGKKTHKKIPLTEDTIKDSIINLGTETADHPEDVMRDCLKKTLLTFF